MTHPFGETVPLADQMVADLEAVPMRIMLGPDVHGDKLAVLGQVSERARATERAEALPDDTVHSGDVPLAEWEHRLVEEAIAHGELTWRHVLMDATFAAYAQRDWPQLRAALLGVAGECVNWILDGDRRALAGGDPS